MTRSSAVAACLALLLGACSPAAEAPQDPAPPTGPGATAEAILPTSGAPSTPASKGGDQVWDPAAWEPTVRIERIGFTDAEREAYYQEMLQRYAEQSGLTDPPAVARLGWAGSRAEFGERMAACMTEAGFPAESDGDAGVFYTPGIPASQEEASTLAMYVCEAQYPLDPALAQEWSEDQLRLVYDYWDQYFIPCMEAHGVAVSREEQPSREAYVVAFHTASRFRWWPNDALMGLPDSRRQELERSCPPYPPAAVMYGE